jgi:hypothetical protein
LNTIGRRLCRWWWWWRSGSVCGTWWKGEAGILKAILTLLVVGNSGRCCKRNNREHQQQRWKSGSHESIHFQVMPIAHLRCQIVANVWRWAMMNTMCLATVRFNFLKTHWTPVVAPACSLNTQQAIHWTW